jgi:hypothetical protein
MKKILLSYLLTAIYISGCSSPVAQQITLPDGSRGLSLSCNGSAYSTHVNWGTCYDKASKECLGKFEIIDREERTVDGDMAMRTLYAKCKR